MITNVLAKYAQEKTNDVAIVFEDKQWTYGALYEGAQKVADYLLKQGLQKGDIVAQYMLNSDLFMVVYYGVQLAGLTIMPINTKLAPPEVEYIFEHSQAKALILDERLETTITQIDRAFNVQLNVTKVNEILAAPLETSVHVNDAASDVAVVMYTSGTTGKPKGVMLSHENIYQTAEIWAESMQLGPADKTYICTPLFHCAGSHVFAVPTLFKGGTLIVDEAFSPTDTLPKLVASEATIFFGVPAMYTLILSKPNLAEFNFEHLRLFCYGAAPMPYELIRQLKDIFPHVRLQNLYGQTENSPATSSLLDEVALTKIGSVGKPLARTEIRLVDAYGEEVPLGEVGEICVKGPQVMLGYLRNPEETAKSVRDGWLFSGDLGKFDEEGYLYIVDRKKDMIIRGGENIYPLEVEEVLFKLPEILEAAVIGVPHEVYGEVPKAYVVFKEGQGLSNEQIIEFCAANLAKYKLPYAIEVIDALPRNASGKVLKHTLKPQHTV